MNVRSVAQSIGITVEEKKSDEPVTFNEWVHVQLFSGANQGFGHGTLSEGNRQNFANACPHALNDQFPVFSP